MPTKRHSQLFVLITELTRLRCGCQEVYINIQCCAVLPCAVLCYPVLCYPLLHCRVIACLLAALS